jgi:hypothetical protein
MEAAVKAVGTPGNKNPMRRWNSMQVSPKRRISSMDSAMKKHAEERLEGDHAKY